MSFKIVTDSSSNIFEVPGVDYACVPMKIITREGEYVDTPDLDVAAMVEALQVTGGPSGSSCPNVHEWEQAFAGADGVFGVTITSKLSGSYASAMQAKATYEQKPGVKAAIIDSLSAGPELGLLVEKIKEGIAAKLSFEEIETAVRAYQEKTHLLFSLKSLTNLARNGRINPAVAKIAQALGICIVGTAKEGTLAPLHKCRTEKKALMTLFASMKEMGFTGGKVRIAHCMNPEGAKKLAEAIKAEFPACAALIEECRGLCSFYAEKGGLLVGFEG